MNLSNKPVSIAVGVVLVAIFTMYQTGKLHKLPCENNLLKNASRDFIHVDMYHLVINMLGLYYISDLEIQIGSVKYTALIAAIVVLSSLYTYLTKKVLDLTCAIGFSGVLLGLMAFALLSQREKLDWKPIFYLVAISVNPGAGNISVSGHLIGIAAGVTAFFGMKMLD
jgi:membrane associated rhomboid family serine protease